MNILREKLKNLFGNQKKKEVKKAFIERPIRIKVQPIHKVHFTYDVNGVAQNLYLYNISSSGLGISRASFKECPLLGDVIKGNLIIEKEIFPVCAIVVHLSDTTVGCHLTEIENRCRMKMSQYFFHELIASKLYPLNSSILKEDPDGKSVCLTGEDRCELHYVEKDSSLVKFSITIMGNYIEVDKNKNVYFGHISEEASDGILKYKPSHLVHRTKLNSREIKQNIERFINNIDEIPEGYKNEMIELIKKAG